MINLADFEDHSGSKPELTSVISTVVKLSVSFDLVCCKSRMCVGFVQWTRFSRPVTKWRLCS